MIESIKVQEAKSTTIQVNYETLMASEADVAVDFSTFKQSLGDRACAENYPDITNFWV